MGNAVLQKLVDERERETQAVDDILEAVGLDERDPTESELQLIARKRERCNEIEAMIRPLLDEEQRRTEAADASKFLRRTASGSEPDARPVVATRSPAPTDSPYRTFAQWAWDSMLVQFPKMAGRFDPAVRERAEERLKAAVANTLLADIPGIAQPQHLTQIFDVISTRRPVVESARRITITSKNTTYPKITQRPIVGVQATEKTEGASQKMTVALQTLASATYFGVGDLSWQDVQFSSPEALGLWFDLAAEAYANATEDVATTALETGATAGPALPAVTPPAENTTADYISAIAKAANSVAAGIKAYPNVIYAAPNIGYRLAGMFGTGQRTFGPVGNVDLATGQGNVGGMRLVTSLQFAAGTIIVGNSDYLLVGETPPAPERLQAVEVSIGGIEVGIIGQFGCVLIDPLAFVKITGGPVTLAAEGESAETPAEGESETESASPHGGGGRGSSRR